MELEERRVLKIAVSEEPVVLKTRETLKREVEDQAAGVVEDAEEAARRIRKESIDEAERIRGEAEVEAAETSKRTEREREEFIAQARLEAQDEAREKTLSEFRPRIEQGVARFEATIREAETVWRGCFEEHKNEVVSLALAIAEKIVHKTCAEDKELVKRTAAAALEKARDRQTVTLRVNPEDLEVVQEFEIELLERFDDLRTFRIEPDRRVDRGGVWVETESGFVDGRIRNQIAEIMNAVLPKEDEVPRGSSPPDETGTEVAETDESDVSEDGEDG